MAGPFTRECVRWIASRRGGFFATRREPLDVETMEKATGAGCRPWSSGCRVGTPVTAGMVAKVRGGGKEIRQAAAEKAPPHAAGHRGSSSQIGRASCRERVE